MKTFGGVTIGGLLSLSAARHPDKTALISGSARLSYRQLEDLSLGLANGLLALGVQKGEKIALLARNCERFVITHFASAKSGTVLVPLNVNLAGDELVRIIGDSDASVLFFAGEFASGIDAIRGRLAGVNRFVAMDASPPPWAIGFDEALRSGSSRPAAVAVSEDDDYLIMYTSGTTGTPKGAVLSHRSRVTVALNGVIDYRMHHEQITVLPVPLYHMGGLNTCLTSHVLSGATVVLLPRFDIGELLRVIERERATFLFLAPTPLYAMIDAPAFRSADLSSVRYVMYGGSPMPADAFVRVSRSLPGVRFIAGYGSTEAGQISALDWPQHERHAGSAGRPCTLTSVRLIDGAGRDVGAGDVGEVAVRGPGVMKGYYRQPHATAEAFRDGWYCTGDLARRDQQGMLTIVDRARDMIVSGAENIYPREIEDVLMTHPAIGDAAVFGIPDDRWGESVCAAVVLKPGVSTGAQELIDFCRERLAGYKKPRKVQFMDALPRNSMGKIVKNLLREPYWRGVDRRI